MPINDDELLAAISGGVDAASTAAPAQETPDVVEDADTDAGEDSNQADGDGSGDPDAGVADDATGEPVSADTDGADGAEDETEELGPDGKPVAKSGDAKNKAADDGVDPATGQPYTPEALAAKKVADEKEAFRKLQVEDPINAPIPKYLKETTQKRMTKLVEIAKETTARLESANRDRSEILGMITETGATATQYTQALQYLKMVNSRDPEQIRAAINVMQQELSALSRMAGVPVAGVDVLADHADLKTAVEAKQITQQLAEEIAAGRNQRAHQTQVSQLTNQNQEAAQREHQAGVRALNDIGKQLAARDPNYRTKAVAVLKTIEGQMKQLPPSQWAQAFLVAYTTYQPPRAPAPAVKKTVVPKNQPLRGNNPSGGVQTAPKTLEEAIGMGIAAGSRRR
jgi:hypothetical protein